ncbi:unnamed protein product [Lactuca virosa]|uniref:DOCKER domain-containing protein n=1 Tax=Lactuca virosa TaxID=75947 RepID=A0AAU9NWL3_9ASTR|nr:unnamed protein product [Lactuca virosa]
MMLPLNTAEMHLANARQDKIEDITDDDVPSTSGRQLTEHYGESPLPAYEPVFDWEKERSIIFGQRILESNMPQSSRFRLISFGLMHPSFGFTYTQPFYGTISSYNKERREKLSEDFIFRVLPSEMQDVHLTEREKQKLQVWSREAFSWAIIPLFDSNTGSTSNGDLLLQVAHLLIVFQELICRRAVKSATQVEFLLWLKFNLNKVKESYTEDSLQDPKRKVHKPVKGVLRLEIEKLQAAYNTEYDNASESGSIANEVDHGGQLTDSTVNEWRNIHSNRHKEQTLNGSNSTGLVDLTVNDVQAFDFHTTIRYEPFLQLFHCLYVYPLTVSLSRRNLFIRIELRKDDADARKQSLELRSEISLPITKEWVPHYLQDTGQERLDYLEDGKNVFGLRLRLCSSLYPISERIRDFFLEYDRHTLRTSPPWGSKLLEAINSLKNVDSTALLQFLHPILNMLLHFIGNGGETLQVASFRAMVNILTRAQQESVDEAERNAKGYRVGPVYDDVLSMAWFFLELIVKSMTLEQTRLLYHNLSLGEDIPPIQLKEEALAQAPSSRIGASTQALRESLHPVLRQKLELWEENLSAAISLQILEITEKFSKAAASHSIATDYGKLDCMTSIFTSIFSRSQPLAFWKSLFPVFNNVFQLHGETLMARENNRFLKQIAFHLLRLAVFCNENIRKRAVIGLQILVRSSFSHFTQTARLRAMLTITLPELTSDVQVTQMKSDGTLEESGEACRLRKSLEEMADESKSGNLLTECGLPGTSLVDIPEKSTESKWSWSEVKFLSNSLLLALNASLEHALLGSLMNTDRYAAAESFYKLAMAFAPVPDLHIMWLLHLCDAHQEMQSWAEAAQCAVAVAGVVMQALVSRNDGVWSNNHVTTLRKIYPLVSTEITSETSAAEVEGYGASKLTVDSAVKYLQLANKLFSQAELYHFCGSILELVIPVTDSWQNATVCSQTSTNQSLNKNQAQSHSQTPHITELDFTGINLENLIKKNMSTESLVMFG